MKTFASLLVALMVLVSGEGALAATGRSPCAICETDDVQCENTTSPSGCVGSNAIPDCTAPQLLSCGGKKPPPQNAEHEKCVLWDLFDGVDNQLNRCDGPFAPYTPYKNCGTYAQAFHYSCLKHGFECRTVNMKCEGQGGHAVNIIKLDDGTWQGIDTTGGSTHCRFLVGKPFPDPDKIPPDTLCLLNFLSPGCTCKVSENSKDPVPPDTAPRMCADMTLNSLRDASGGYWAPWSDHGSELAPVCRGCCGTISNYHYSIDLPGARPITERWIKECQGFCNQLNPNDRLRPALDSGALYFENVCRPQASKGANKFRLCQGCRACCEAGAKKPAKYGADKINSCLVRCNAEWSCGLPVK